MNNLRIIGIKNNRTYCYLLAAKTYQWPVKDVLIYGHEEDSTQHNLDEYYGRSFQLGNFKLDFQPQYNDLLAEYDVKYDNSSTFNSLENVLSDPPGQNILFSGKGKVSEQLVNNHTIIHAHPGKLPAYKGSTTFYYSLLQEKKLYCSCFHMSTNLDGGEVINAVEFNLAECIGFNIDDILDPLVRAACINQTFMSKSFDNSQPQNEGGNMYYKIHPVLRAIIQQKLISNA